MMEQIPYACGRLGELAQDIRWRAGQLPALREADGAADLRQIAQQIQKLVSALSESVLLLEELDLPKVSAYTAQLSAAPLVSIPICFRACCAAPSAGVLVVAPQRMPDMSDIGILKA